MEYFKELNNEEKWKLAKKLWQSENMQKYLVDKYDFYKTKDDLIIELEKVNKITINKTMYYDDETEPPVVNENNFINYNRSNIPGRNLENYLEEKENLKTKGCASGRYDYQGIYFTKINEECFACDWSSKHDERYFKRYLTSEEEKEYIELMETRKQQYLERLKKYFKRYGEHINTYGYWANR